MTADVTRGWLDTPMGQAVLASESSAVERALAQMFGIHLLQVGSWGEPDQFLRHARTRRQSIVAGFAAPGVASICRPSRLGIGSDSVDAVLLPHTLEIDPDPHQVLREVSRVLVGEGHLVVLGFRPWSLWGVRHFVSRGAFPHGSRRLISERRLRDWLALLGLEVSEAHRCVLAPPINRESVQRRLGAMEEKGNRYWSHLSGAYLLVAQKRVHAITPWRPQRFLKPRVAAGLVKPTTRSAA